MLVPFGRSWMGVSEALFCSVATDKTWTCQATNLGLSKMRASVTLQRSLTQRNSVHGAHLLHKLSISSVNYLSIMNACSPLTPEENPIARMISNRMFILSSIFGKFHTNTPCNLIFKKNVTSPLFVAKETVSAPKVCACVCTPIICTPPPCTAMEEVLFCNEGQWKQPCGLVQFAST